MTLHVSTTTCRKEPHTSLQVFSSPLDPLLCASSPLRCGPPPPSGLQGFVAILGVKRCWLRAGFLSHALSLSASFSSWSRISPPDEFAHALQTGQPRPGAAMPQAQRRLPRRSRSGAGDASSSGGRRSAHHRHAGGGVADAAGLPLRRRRLMRLWRRRDAIRHRVHHDRTRRRNLVGDLVGSPQDARRQHRGCAAQGFCELLGVFRIEPGIALRPGPTRHTVLRGKARLSNAWHA